MRLPLQTGWRPVASLALGVVLAVGVEWMLSVNRAPSLAERVDRARRDVADGRFDRVVHAFSPTAESAAVSIGIDPSLERALATVAAELESSDGTVAARMILEPFFRSDRRRPATEILEVWSRLDEPAEHPRSPGREEPSEATIVAIAMTLSVDRIADSDVASVLPPTARPIEPPPLPVPVRQSSPAPVADRKAPVASTETKREQTGVVESRIEAATPGTPTANSGAVGVGRLGVEEPSAVDVALAALCAGISTTSLPSTLDRIRQLQEQLSPREREELRSIAHFNASLRAVLAGRCEEGLRLAMLAAKFDDPWRLPSNRSWLRTLQRIRDCADFNLSTSAGLIQPKLAPTTICGAVGDAR